MPHYLEAVAAGPWILAVVFVVAGLDAVLPFMPSESTVVACGVASAGTGNPALGLLVVVAAAGAYAGDQIAFRIGRQGGRQGKDRLRHRRAVAVHAWVHRLLHRRGRLLIMFARYLPGGRSATAMAAGLVGYPAARFGWFTAAGVVLWAIEAALLGYLGGSVFAGRPLAGFLLGWAGAAVLTGTAILISRCTTEQSARRPVPATEDVRQDL